MAFWDRNKELLCFISCILLRTFPVHSYPDLIASYVYDFEKDIPDHEDCHDSVIMIVSDEQIEFEPITLRPFMIFVGKSYNLIAEFHITKCIILVLPEFTTLSDKVSDLLNGRFTHVKKAIIYPKSEEYTDIRKERDKLKMQVHVVNKTTGAVRKYETLKTRCGGNAKFYLNKRVLRIGYSPSVYFEVFHWDEHKAMGKPIPPIVLNRTNGVEKYFRGLEAALLKMLVVQYGMTLVMIASSDYSFGRKHANGSWDGKLGLLGRKEVNMLIPSIVGTAERTEIGVYSTPFRISRFTLASKKNKHQSQQWESLLLSFDCPTWIAIFASVGVVCPSAWLITKIHNQIRGAKAVKHQSVLTTSGVVYAALVGKPGKPPSGPAALIVGSWMVCCLTIQIGYISNFMSNLSMPDPEQNLDTLEDIWREKKRIIVPPGGVLENLLKDSHQPYMKDLYNWRLPMKEVGDAEFVKLLGRGFVGAGGEWLLKERIYKGGVFDKYHISPKPFLTAFSAWLYQPYQPGDRYLMRCIDKVLGKAVAGGLIDHWEQENERQIEQLKKNEYASEEVQHIFTEETVGLALYHLQSVFFFWILGLAVSVVIGFLERASIVVKKKPEDTIPIYPYLP